MAHTNQYVIQKVTQWSKELKALSSVASTQSHAVYVAFTHGMVSKWQYLSRTIPNIGDHLQPFEDVIRTQLIPALMGRAAPNENERMLLSLPARLGGLGIINLTDLSASEYPASRRVTKPLFELILQQLPGYSTLVSAEQKTASL